MTLQKQGALEKALLRMVYYCTSLDKSQACLSSYRQTSNAKAKGIPAMVTDQIRFILKVGVPTEELL